MELNDYQEVARETAIYPHEHNILGLVYTTLGLSGEAGEVANQVKKILRDDNFHIHEVKRQELKLELGDVLWYLAMSSKELGFSLEEIASANLEKLKKRKDEGTIKGKR